MREVYKICTEYIDGIYSQIHYNPISGKSIEETIFNTLVGSSRTIRLGSKPSEETKREILKRIREKVEKNMPLEVTSAWGAIKTISSEDRGVDLAEYVTLNQFHKISQVIKEIYKPGIKFNVYLGDSYYKYLYGEDDRIEGYTKVMEMISKDFQEINLISLEKQCSSIPDVEQQCRENYEVLRKYWVDSNSVPDELHEQLESHKELRKAGWVGVITSAMREFYLKRMALLYPDKPHEYWVDKAIHFFAYGLMISKNDLMGRRSSKTCTVDACLLRVPPPDLPRELYSNRLRMRITPEAIIKSSAPPWTVAGVIKINSSNEPKLCILNAEEFTKTELKYFKYKGMTVGVYYEQLSSVKDKVLQTV